MFRKHGFLTAKISLCVACTSNSNLDHILKVLNLYITKDRTIFNLKRHRIWKISNTKILRNCGGYAFRKTQDLSFFLMKLME